MHARRTKAALLLVLVLSSGTLFQGASGCVTFTGQGLLSSFDFCYLLDCQNLLFGLLRPCNDPTTSEDDVLQDCPPATGG